MINQDFGGGEWSKPIDWDIIVKKQLPPDAGSHNQPADVSTEGTLLGKNTPTPTKYDPSVLVKVPRNIARDVHGIKEKSFTSGNDLWRAYECSTLSKNGMPVYFI